jgi:hypothetical protein
MSWLFLIGGAALLVLAMLGHRSPTGLRVGQALTGLAGVLAGLLGIIDR